MLKKTLLLCAIAISTSAFADDETKVLGKSIGVWSSIWWKWSLSIPASMNPMKDNSGANCSVGQKGKVWFLAGNFAAADNTPVVRNCTIPAKKYILFPIANSIWVQTPQDDPLYTEPDFRRLANENLPQSIGGELEATLDDNRIIFNPKTPITQSQSPIFTVVFPSDNVFGVDASLLTGSPIVSDGYWVMLPPLSVGDHVLHFRAGKDATLTQDITYHLTVKKGK